MLRNGEGNGTPLQYSCLDNPMDGGAWQAVVHGVAKSRTRLSIFTFTFHFPALEKEMASHSRESQGRGSLVGCRLWGRTESDTTEVTQQQQQHVKEYTDISSSHCFFLFSLHYFILVSDFICLQWLIVKCNSDFYFIILTFFLFGFQLRYFFKLGIHAEYYFVGIYHLDHNSFSPLIH